MNTLSPVFGTVWKGLRGVVWLKELYNHGWPSRLQKPTPLWVGLHSAYNFKVKKEALSSIIIDS